VNDVGRHFPGTPFGGYKQSGIGREECLEELISYTQEKSIIIILSFKKAGNVRTAKCDAAVIRISNEGLSNPTPGPWQCN